MTSKPTTAARHDARTPMSEGASDPALKPDQRPLSATGVAICTNTSGC